MTSALSGYSFLNLTLPFFSLQSLRLPALVLITLHVPFLMLCFGFFLRFFRVIMRPPCVVLGAIAPRLWFWSIAAYTRAMPPLR